MARKTMERTIKIQKLEVGVFKEDGTTEIHIVEVDNSMSEKKIIEKVKTSTGSSNATILKKELIERKFVCSIDDFMAIATEIQVEA
ncbi:MAG: hypothetical protein RR500_04845 [Bacilli bacterium]